MARDSVAAEQQRFMTKVYGWMAFALSITAVTAWYIAANRAFAHILVGSFWPFVGIAVVEIILVYILARSIDKLSVTTAVGLFLLYSLLNGALLSVIFLVYTTASIGLAFLVTAGMFGAMSFYGYTTQKDLTGWGGFLFMALIGLILATIVNFFFVNSIFYWITSVIGVLIFVALTAYDTQKIKELNVLGNEGTDADRKEAIHGALSLYLDFINLFLQLLALLGKRKN